MIESNGADHEKEFKKQELLKYTNEIEAYLNPPYNYIVPEDPITVAAYKQHKDSMARTNNVLEVAQKVEYLCHPKVKLVSDEAKPFLLERALVLRSLVAPDWAKEAAKQSKEGHLTPEIVEKLMPTERTYRLQDEVDIIRSSIQKVVATLYEELGKLQK